MVIYIWENYNDLTSLPHWNHGLFEGNHPKMAASFRLVNCCNLLRSYESTIIVVIMVIGGNNMVK